MTGTFEKFEKIAQENNTNGQNNKLARVIYEILVSNESTKIHTSIKENIANKIDFLVGFPNSLNIPLAIVATVVCILLGLLVIKFLLLGAAGSKHVAFNKLYVINIFYV